MPRHIKFFTDLSRATRLVKARRVIQSLASPTDRRYFYGDGFPRRDELQKDAAATLEVFDELTKLSDALEKMEQILREALKP